VEIAKLVLEFIRVLIWPTVALTAIFAFKNQLVALFERLHDAELPGGIKLNFEKEVRQAQDLSREVKESADEQDRSKTPKIPLSEIIVAWQRRIRILLWQA
jgi:hypothetical protein